jgi:hypothetical protein
MISYLIAMPERLSPGCSAGGMTLQEASIVMISGMLASTFCRGVRQRIRDSGGRLMMKEMKLSKPTKVE